jgi:hypothetical protein
VRHHDSCAADLMGSVAPSLIEQLDALCHTSGTRRVPFGLKVTTRIHR